MSTAIPTRRLAPRILHHPSSIAPRVRHPLHPRRKQPFSTSPPFHQQQQHRKASFGSRLRSALAATRIQWRPIPVAAGIAFLAAFQLYRIRRHQSRESGEEWRGRSDGGSDDEVEPGRPKRRPRIRPSGPWQVQVMSTLPLKFLSRVWGKFNELEIPYYLRVPGFKLYGWIFGVNFDEIAEPDLHVYPNLASFFYRTLKPGARPLDPHPNALLSPADGKVVQFGCIEHGEVEQVKGVTYSLDALLGGAHSNSGAATPTSNIASSPNSAQPSPSRTREGDQEVVRADEEFARVNGISYTLPNLFSGTSTHPSTHREGGQPADHATDQSTRARSSSEAAVRADLAQSPTNHPWWTPAASVPTSLYYCVVYLAPGDYHRFHSPASWIVSSRRHFAGELYSVSPYLQRTLPGLFTLNERVVLLGRWRWGFFSCTPVGATNVGSIRVNFDRELRTNSLTTDTAADRAAAAAAARGEMYAGYAEATYGRAGDVLRGHALQVGEEMGGFRLGSTVVLVFEAPRGRRPTFDEGYDGGGRRGGWEWCVEKGMQVRVGQKLGLVGEE